MKNIIKPPTKFTQGVKDKWLEALKSGKYNQGYCTLYNKRTDSYCCLGVLADITEGLSCDCDANEESSPYIFIRKVLGRETEHMLWKNNDGIIGERSVDFIKMIPIIESLPVQE